MSRSHSPSLDLITYIRGNCKTVLGSRFWDTRYVSKVDVGPRPDKTDARILVLSKFRVHIVTGKTVAKLQVESSAHLLSIDALQVTSANTIALTLDDGRKWHVRCADARELTVELLTALKHYLPGAGEHMPWRLVDADLVALMPSLPHSRPSLPADNFRRAYACMCDYYRQPVRDEVVWDVEKIYASHGARTLRLDDFTHLTPKDLVPIVAVLMYSRWFSGLLIENLKLIPELIDAILLVVSRSQHLRTLVLRNCALNKEFVVGLAAAFDANPTLPLDCLDMCDNQFDDTKSLLTLSNAMSKCTHGLRELHMSGCSMTAKGVNHMCNALFRQQLACARLTRLALAGNSLRAADDTNDITNLLSHCAELEELDLAGTGWTLDKIWSSLKYGGLRLKVLRINGCIMKTSTQAKNASPTSTNLKDFFASAVALRTVSMVECRMSPDSLKCVLLGLSCNQTCTDVHLDLTGTCTERAHANVLETCLPNCRAITSLVLRDCALDAELLTLVPQLARMTNLRRLDLGGINYVQLRKTAAGQQQLSVVLVEIVKLINDDESTVRELILSDARLGSHLAVLLNALGVCSTLQHLDIQGNDMGNHGARLLAKALQINTSVRAVLIDRNRVGADGWADLAHSLQQNGTLRQIPFPIYDILELTKHATANERAKAERLLAQIERQLVRNRSRTTAAHVGERMTTSLVDDTSEHAFAHGHCKLAMANIEEELNRTIYAAQETLDGLPSAAPPAVGEQLRGVLEEADKCKMVRVYALVCYSLQVLAGPLPDGADVIDQLVNKVYDNVASAFSEHLQSAVGALVTHLLPTAHPNDELCEQLMAIAQKRLAGTGGDHVRVAMRGLRAELIDEYRSVTTSTLCALLERCVQEQCTELAAVTQSHVSTSASTTGGKPRSTSQNSLNAQHQGSPSTSSPTHQNITPKTRRKMRIFDTRNSRPKSIVNGEQACSSLETSEIMTSSDEGASLSVAIVDGSQTLDMGTNVAAQPADRLIAMQKSRARLGAALGNQRRAPTRLPAQPRTADEFGTDTFFQQRPPTPSDNHNDNEQPMQTENKPTPATVVGVLKDKSALKNETGVKTAMQPPPKSSIVSTTNGAPKLPTSPMPPVPVMKTEDSTKKTSFFKPGLPPKPESTAAPVRMRMSSSSRDAPPATEGTNVNNNDVDDSKEDREVRAAQRKSVLDLTARFESTKVSKPRTDAAAS